MEIPGKVALVTGGGSGIGRASARLLAREGACVVVADIDAEGGHETVDLIGAAGGKASYIRADVAEPADAARMVEHAETVGGGLDILHNNAGMVTGLPGFPEADPARWSRVLDVNLRGVILGTHCALPALRRRGGGVVVNTASIAGFVGFPLDPVYSATKGGVILFTAALQPLAGEGIRVNCVCPGLVDTPMATRTLGELPESLRSAFPVDQMSWIPPEDIADAVLDLIRDDSLTGCAVQVPAKGAREMTSLSFVPVPLGGIGV